MGLLGFKLILLQQSTKLQVHCEDLFFVLVVLQVKCVKTLLFDAWRGVKDVVERQVTKQSPVTQGTIEYHIDID